MSPAELPTRLDPAAIDRRWQERWAEADLFRAPSEPRGKAFSIILPPPNVTGVLHMGHLLSDTLQDALVRCHRMRGDSVLWQPGIDHAGLSTQVEVRKRLAKQGIDLDRMGREEVIARVQEWKEEHEKRIREQIALSGFSLDWSRYRYTMDAASIRATRKVFVQLYREGLIYRGDRIVNWDPKLRTAVSDLEVFHREEPVDLLYLTYHWADGSPGGLTVATVRPETIFGDVAVAVHPGDERHRAAVGRAVRVPLVEREVPVIADEAVDPTFGNGSLKVTPRHDGVDFAIARRHPELPMPPPVLDAGGRLTGDWVPAAYHGLSREEARTRTTEALAAAGLIERTERIQHSVALSERTEAVIEPTLSRQWFVRMAPLAEPAMAAVRRNEVRLHPERWTPTFFHWMETIQDWCISRQVHWGHPIPVLYCQGCQREIVEESPPVACATCGSRTLAPDPDVLDTWFSSWLWPFSSLGWPEETADLAHYYPTSVLVTGPEIVFFWVARMLMAGYHFRNARPFSDVLFNGMLRDSSGRTMKKHLGNSPDPVDLLRQWGADAVRLALVFPSPADQDVRFSTAPIEGARNFLTKVWNLVRLLLSHLPEGSEPVRAAPVLDADAPLEDRWILGRWRRTLEEVDRALSAFELTPAVSALFQFLWHDVADRYVEIAKPALSGSEGEAAARRSRAVLLFVLDRSIRALHPFVPHVTEELWHALPHEGEFLATAPWPIEEETSFDPEVELEAEALWTTVRALRLLRGENKVPAADRPAAWVRPSTEEVRGLIDRQRPAILRLARVSSVGLLSAGTDPPEEALAHVTPTGEVFLPRSAAGADSEGEALEREREKLGLLLVRSREKLADSGFRARAPPEVVRASEEKASELERRIQQIDTLLAARRPASEAA
ncbi:MAG TPA: valine--tRNA ligase [Thermoplasmata archaeon]|nr:valine--tRNA ligase [Thermoplasmata archaeon]